MQFKRTISCGLVDSTLVNKTIDLCGWVHRRRDHGGLIFIDLRDRSGIMQLVFNDAFSKVAHEDAHKLRSEYVICVSGTVVERSAQTVNNEIPTGKYELQVTALTILNKAKNLPFMLEEDNVDEELRLKYRYLDLRRPEMLHRLQLRNNVFFAMREFLQKQGFYEVETPLLTKNTGEGAREFLVPSRVNQGSFYALPQSPQLYKQLLMAGGIERYFQIARCFRDEDLRADRQPEFTQLDLEMSFINEKDIQTIIENLLNHVWKMVFGKELTLPFPRITWDQALADYGSDKPDLRFDLKIKDCTSLFANTELKFLKSVLSNNGKIGAVHIEKHAFSRSELEGYVAKAQQMGAQGLVWLRLKDGVVESPIAKFLPTDFVEQIKTVFPTFAEDSTLFIVAGDYQDAWTILGRLRLQLAHDLNMIPQDEFNFSWVTDFPLFAFDKETKKWHSVNHPFTSPQDGWQTQDNSQMKARAYDVILNGVELGGGSIRIYNSEIQDKVFQILGLNKQEMQDQFGFLLEAQDLGFPPHGGIALGLDRLVMLMSNASSIREVIAFPKTARGHDPMMDAPTQVNPLKLRDYGLKLNEKLTK
ncbi:aspartate--tRNA ligase [Candidatus Dependentiae bacterium Noda2021]|nr:aspartate--tRNA ligase [Candidatus Dependentiae bacterium Noda2021]